MNLRILMLVFGLTPAVALAEVPKAMPSIVIEYDFALRLEAFLTHGGTIAQSGGLLAELRTAAGARSRELETLARIEAALGEERAKVAKAQKPPASE